MSPVLYRRIWDDQVVQLGPERRTSAVESRLFHMHTDREELLWNPVYDLRRRRLAKNMYMYNILLE